MQRSRFRLLLAELTKPKGLAGFTTRDTVMVDKCDSRDRGNYATRYTRSYVRVFSNLREIFSRKSNQSRSVHDSEEPIVANIGNDRRFSLICSIYLLPLVFTPSFVFLITFL